MGAHDSEHWFIALSNDWPQKRDTNKDHGDPHLDLGSSALACNLDPPEETTLTYQAQIKESSSHPRARSVSASVNLEAVEVHRMGLWYC